MTRRDYKALTRAVVKALPAPDDTTTQAAGARDACAAIARRIASHCARHDPAFSASVFLSFCGVDLLPESQPRALTHPLESTQ